MHRLAHRCHELPEQSPTIVFHYGKSLWPSADGFRRQLQPHQRKDQQRGHQKRRRRGKEPSEGLSGRRKDLEEVAESSRARKSVDMEAICRAPTTSSVAAASDSPCLDVTGESRLRNPLRKICTVGSVREEISRWCHGGPKRARSWKRRTQPRKTYSLSGLLYSERRLLTTVIGKTVSDDVGFSRLL